MHDVTSSLQFEQMLMFHLFHRDRRMVRALGSRGFRTYQTPCSNTHLRTLLDLLVVAWTKHLHSIHLHPKKQLPGVCSYTCSGMNGPGNAQSIWCPSCHPVHIASCGACYALQVYVDALRKLFDDNKAGCRWDSKLELNMDLTVAGPDTLQTFQFFDVFLAGFSKWSNLSYSACSVGTRQMLDIPMRSWRFCSWTDLVAAGLMQNNPQTLYISYIYILI